MNSELFERLLFEEENATLDFKKEQYRFVKATDEEKSELLKDILGFANAWRRSDAYILIGVKDFRGGRGSVVGIPAADHLDDHSLQQFVNNLTNQPVRFRYEAFGFEGKQVGVISIDEQTRPIYLKRDYGKLLKEKVYVRRGSSTDPTKPASPDEIAQMRVGSGQHAADLVVEFAHIERDDLLGKSISWNAEFCEMPAREAIPDLSSKRQPAPFGLAFASIGLDRPNEGYFRQLARFEFVRRLFRPVRLAVINVGQVAATNVRVEIRVPKNTGTMLLRASGIPDRPKRRDNLLITRVPTVMPSPRREPGVVEVAENTERVRIEIDCGGLQPGRQIRSDVFYLGQRTSGDFSLCGSVFADNLPQPKEFELTVSVTATKTAMTVDELCSYEN